MPLLGLASGLFRAGGLRATVYALFGGLMLSTLWVTSLTVLSARSSATELLTDAGTQVLNGFLVKQGLGLTPAAYAQAQASGKAHPNQPVALPLLKAQVLGREIAGLGYGDGVRLIYSRVAATYYDGGPSAAFAIPDQLSGQLPDFALFDPNNQPLVPGGPTPAQLPTFVQPLFTFVGLTPATLTAAGHQNLLDLLPWFWIAAGVLGALAIALNRSEVKVAALLHGLLHSSWPIVGTLAGLWVAAQLDAAVFAPYAAMLGIVDRAFLPVYGAALVVGGAGLLLTKVLPGAHASAQPAGGGQPSEMEEKRAQAIREALERATGAAGTLSGASGGDPAGGDSAGAIPPATSVPRPSSRRTSACSRMTRARRDDPELGPPDE
jgi:hypothetical protein